MATRGITKAERFADIKNLLLGNETTHGTDVETAVAFIDHELELLAKKNSGTSTKKAETAKVNENYKQQIMEFLIELPTDSVGVTCTEIVDAKNWWKECSVNRTAALLRQLKDEGKVISKTVKGKNRFTVA